VTPSDDLAAWLCYCLVKDHHPYMSFVPIDGLRMLAVETGLLVALTVLAYLFLRFSPVAARAPRWLKTILEKNSRSVLLVIALALVGRVLLLPWFGVPQPHMNDEYSYLLMGDTFSHFRLANPTPSAWQHFETFHVNMTPTYHSKYPVAQGVFLAIGEVVFRQPWVGVLLSTALMCGAICWTLQAFLPAGWALLGGLLAAARFAVFSYWVNSYWGGSPAALGGALALGAVVRLFEERRTRRSPAVIASAFAISLLLLATSRPFEGLAFSLPLLGYFAYRLTRGLLRHKLELRSTLLPIVAIGIAGLLMIGFYNRQTTGNAMVMPYVLYERTYASIPLFFGQKVKTIPPAHDPVFAKYYVVEAEEHDTAKADTVSGLIGLEVRRIWSDWFFYVGVALSFPVFIGVLLCAKRRDLWLVLAVWLTTGLAVAMCSFTQAHYLAPATAAIYIFAIAGLQYLWEQEGAGGRAFVVAAYATVVIVSLTRNTPVAAMNAEYRFVNTRESVIRQLQEQGGRHLVLVSYDMPRHYPGDELVHNGANLGNETVLWARSKGTGNDADLCQAYPDRTFWMLRTDDMSYSLSRLDLCK
jgi:hypothetical protein